MKRTLPLVVMALVATTVWLIAATLPSLTPLATATDDDILYIVDDPGGTAADRKITAANLRTYMVDGLTESDIDFSATQRVLGRNTAGAGAGEEVTVSQLLDWVGGVLPAQGSILYRSAAIWANLAAGTDGQFLRSQGAGADVLWSNDGSALTGTGATNANQFVTLSQLEGAVSGGEVTYFTDVAANGFTLTGTTISTNYADETLPAQWTNAVSSVADGNYAAAFITTNTFKTLASGLARVEVYCYENVAQAHQMNAEAYIVNSVTLEEEYEFEPSAAYQTIPAGTTPTLLSFSVPVTDYVSTTNLHLMVRFKVSTATTPTINFVGGGNYPSHVAFPLPLSSYLSKSGGTMEGEIAMGGNAISGLPADAFDSGWNGDDSAATKNDIYDEMIQKLEADNAMRTNALVIDWDAGEARYNDYSTNAAATVSFTGSATTNSLPRSLTLHSYATAPIALTIPSSYDFNSNTVTTVWITPGFTELSWIYTGSDYVVAAAGPDETYTPTAVSASTNFVPNYAWGSRIGLLTTMTTNLYIQHITNSYAGAHLTWHVFANGSNVVVSAPDATYLWPTNLDDTITIPANNSATISLLSYDDSNTNISIAVAPFSRQ